MTLIDNSQAAYGTALTSAAVAPFTVTNGLMVPSSGQSSISFMNVPRWVIEYTNLYTGVFPNPSGDEVLLNNLGVAPGGVGGGGCLVYLPTGSNMKGAGKDGGDIGANVLRRYEDGVLTGDLLWDRVTGAFPCGATVPGINDVPGTSCFDVHLRIHVNGSGCPLP
jgi:hypothetical protein